MKIFLTGLLLTVAVAAHSQTVNASYINPMNVGSDYTFVRLGTPTNYFGGLMHNINGSVFGNGDDFTVFAYHGRDLVFKTYTGGNFHFSGGYVGIGNFDPKAELDVSGSIVSRAGYLGALNPNNQSAEVSLSWLNDVARIRVGGNNPGAGYGLDIQGPQDASLMRIKGVGVGIGTDDPLHKLQVIGDARIQGSTLSVGQSTLGVDNTQGSSSGNVEANRPFTIRRHSGNTEAMNMYVQDAAAYFTYVNDEAVSRVHFRLINADTEGGGGNGTNANANDTYVLTLHGNKNGGAVSIGQEALPTGFRLSVDGKAIMEEVVVQLASTWPDYVFDQSYELTSLEDLKTTIQKQGHLPNIPSAAEVAEKGISLGEMNAKLLEKIEELTLHIIKLNDDVKQQQKEIEELKKK